METEKQMLGEEMLGGPSSTVGHREDRDQMGPAGFLCDTSQEREYNH